MKSCTKSYMKNFLFYTATLKAKPSNMHIAYSNIATKKIATYANLHF